MITGYQNFTYLGYTMGEVGWPTFYFTEGRYTQKHKNPENVGWHPRKKYHRAANIRSEWALFYSNLRKSILDLSNKINSSDEDDVEGGLAQLQAGLEELKRQSAEFKTKFVKGEFDALVLDINDKYFECSTNEEKFATDYARWIAHPSRSQLIVPTDQRFLVQYNVDAAKRVLANGNLAANEK